MNVLCVQSCDPSFWLISELGSHTKVAHPCFTQMKKMIKPKY